MNISTELPCGVFVVIVIVVFPVGAEVSDEGEGDEGEGEVRGS